jgi:hypothetical protein
MDRLNILDSLRVLLTLKEDTILFVSYIPGRKPTPRAYAEARRSVDDEGIAPRHFTGKFKGARVTKKNEIVFTLWVEERDHTENGRLVPGAYRAFNPSLGTLLALDVLQKA